MNKAVLCPAAMCTLFVLGTVFLISACTKDRSPEELLTPTAAALLDEANKDKDKLISDLNAKLSEYDTQIETLKSQAKDLQGEARDKVLAKIDQLEKKRGETAREIEQLGNLGGKTWDDLVSNLKGMWRQVVLIFQ